MAKPKRPRVYTGPIDAHQRCIMAARNFAEFQAATGIGRNYAHLADDRDEIAQAETERGAVFVQPHSAPPGSPWTRLKGRAPRT